MTTMSYCAFENTSADMGVALDKLEDMDKLEDLTDDERDGLEFLVTQCAKFISLAERFNIEP